MSRLEHFNAVHDADNTFFYVPGVRIFPYTVLTKQTNHFSRLHKVASIPFHIRYRLTHSPNSTIRGKIRPTRHTKLQSPSHAIITIITVVTILNTDVHRDNSQIMVKKRFRVSIRGKFFPDRQFRVFDTAYTRHFDRLFIQLQQNNVSFLIVINDMHLIARIVLDIVITIVVVIFDDMICRYDVLGVDKEPRSIVKAFRKGHCDESKDEYD